MEIKIGTIIDGRYKVTARIGHGGMAEVYEAVDIFYRTKVALKMIRDDVMKDPINLARFENEALIASSLEHPNIVKVLSQGDYDGRPFIANEYVSGQCLSEVLDFRSTLPITEALDVMLQLTQALSYAHNHDIVHRDVKPENIFVMSDGSIKLADFGIAQAGQFNANTNDKEVVGSVLYLAPEIIMGKPASPQSDIYAAGVTFFELLTGHVPFESKNAIDVATSHVKEKFPSIRKYLPNISKEIEEIIFKATKKDLTERYQNANEFYNDLLRAKNNPEVVDEKKSFLSRLFGFK